AYYARREKVESVAVEVVEALGNRAAGVEVRITTAATVRHSPVYVSKRDRLWLVDWERTLDLNGGAAPENAAGWRGRKLFGAVFVLLTAGLYDFGGYRS